MTEAFAGSELSSPAPQQAVFIVGSGRSGSSALACTLQILGMHVPAPEVPPDNTNPKGFGESQWVVDLHDRMLRRANVAVSDARPQAWFDTGKLSTNERLRETVKAWAEAQFSEDISEIVLKDPRLAWFIGLWRSAVLRSGIEPSYAVTLRPPAEVIASKQKYYSVRVSESSRAASWVNHMLHTERATRGSRRAFVRYHDLLDGPDLPPGRELRARGGQNGHRQGAPPRPRLHRPRPPPRAGQLGRPRPSPSVAHRGGGDLAAPRPAGRRLG